MERFCLNPETLSYQRINATGWQKLFRFIAFMGFVFFIAFGIMVLRDRHFQSLRKGILMAQQQEITYEMNLMNRDINQYEYQLDQLAFNDDRIYRVYFEVEPLSSSMREVGVGGASNYNWLNQYKFSQLLKKTYLGIEQVERKLAMQSSSFDQVINLAWNKEEAIASRPAIQPVSMQDLTHFGSSFGVRMHPILNEVRPHEGIDLTAPLGTQIYATADGMVLQAGYRTGGFGKKIFIDHGFGYSTLYGHCDEILVVEGQLVKRGEVIGTIGNTGLSKAPHLHYEVHVNGRPVDPVNYYASDLSASEYEKMIQMLSDADPSFDIN